MSIPGVHPTATAGDVGQYRDVVLGEKLAGQEFQAIDFTGAVDDVEAHVWKKGSDPAVASTTLAAAFTSAATGTVRVQLGDETGWLAGLTVPRGKTHTYVIEYEVFFSDGTSRTFGPDELPVRGELG